MRKTYTVTAEREGDWWVLRFPDLRGASQARRLNTAERVAKDYINALTDEPVDSFDVMVVPQLGERLEGLLHETTEAREHAAEAQRRAGSLSFKSATELQGLGLSMRDIGLLLGVTHQRASQLLAGHAAPPRLASGRKRRVRLATSADHVSDVVRLGALDRRVDRGPTRSRVLGSARSLSGDPGVSRAVRRRDK